MINIERYPKHYHGSTKFSKEQKYKDYVGNQYGECIVKGFPGYINRTDSNTSKTPAVLLECSCGKYFVSNWYQVKNGRVLSCGHINALYKEDTTEAACNDLMCRYKHSARKRNLDFELTYKQFRDITSQHCHYCGSKPQQVRTCKNCQEAYSHNGIDRKNPELGYVDGNCLPSCWICNRAKSTMKYDEFKAYLNQVVEFASSQKTSGKNGES